MSSVDSYSDLVEACKPYKKIIVAGPQRSGTTFVARSLASSLGYQIVDESESPDKFDCKSYVWQFASRLHTLQDFNDYDLVIWMNREKKDVQASEKRIGWSFFEQHKKEYISVFGDRAKAFDNNYDMKHYFWNAVQKDAIQSDFIEFDYSNLLDAPDYLTKDKRVGFSSKQTC